VAEAREPAAALVALVAFHVDFALNNPAVIALHLHELDRLPDEPRREIRRLQRLYVEEWVRVLMALRAELAAQEARVLAHAAFGLMNSTPFLSGEVDRGALRRTATRGYPRGAAGLTYRSGWPDVDQARPNRRMLTPCVRSAGTCVDHHVHSQGVDNPVDNAERRAVVCGQPQPGRRMG